MTGQASQDGPVVQTASGALRGEHGPHGPVFRGVPYAAAPVGPLRWRAPQPHPAWSGLREATRFGMAAPQAGPDDVADITVIGGAPEPTGEDCLTLNLWAPAPGGAPAPVMVWLHGGSNRMGAASLPFYDGSAFARDGVILIGVNYRLGRLGFFAHPELSRAVPDDEPLGHQGLADQIAALEWVRGHIAAFGGDPGNVVLFGESAGGLDILALMTSPRARGLFHKAIVQSGGGWLPAATLKDAEKRGLALEEALGRQGLDSLKSASAADIAAVPGAFGPTVDGRLLPRDPISAFARGEAADIPLMIGFNSGEDSLLNYGGGLERFGKLVRPNRTLARLYPEAKGEREGLIRLGFRDFAFGAPARWIARRPRRSPTWLYGFTHVETARRPEMTRAGHGAEIFHVFETLDQRPDSPPPADDADRAVAAALHARWVAFAHKGSPGDDWAAHTETGDDWRIFDSTPGGSAAKGWLKPQLDHHARKGRLLVFLIGLRDRLSPPKPGKARR